MNLDALVGPPSVGTSEGTPDALIAAAEAKITAEVAEEEMVVLHLRHIEDAVERGCDLDGVEVVFELEGAGEKAPKKLEWKTIESSSKDSRWEAEIKPAVLGEIKKIFEVYKSVELVPKREMLETMAKHAKRWCFWRRWYQSRPRPTSTESSPRSRLASSSQTR